MKWPTLFGRGKNLARNSVLPPVPSPLRYYVYRSTSKIEMLWEQIDAQTRLKYAADLKVKMPFVEGGAKAEIKSETLQTKLDVVQNYLTEKRQIGHLGSKKPYVHGRMPMTWQELKFYRGVPEFRMVLFVGCTRSNDNTDVDSKSLVVGLVGSAAFVTGMNSVEPATLGYSQPDFWSRVVEGIEAPSRRQMQNNMYDLGNQIDYQGRRRNDGPPKRIVEFCARVFAASDHMIVGSPVYVAEVDQ